jgi:hypothetical protein
MQVEVVTACAEYFSIENFLLFVYTHFSCNSLTGTKLVVLVTDIYTVELGYNVMKGTAYFVSL